MKRLLIFISIITLLGVVPSCGKKEISGDEPMPEWLHKEVRSVPACQNN